MFAVLHAVSQETCLRADRHAENSWRVLWAAMPRRERKEHHGQGRSWTVMQPPLSTTWSSEAGMSWNCPNQGQALSPEIDCSFNAGCPSGAGITLDEAAIFCRGQFPGRTWLCNIYRRVRAWVGWLEGQTQNTNHASSSHDDCKTNFKVFKDAQFPQSE